MRITRIFRFFVVFATLCQIASTVSIANEPTSKAKPNDSKRSPNVIVFFIDDLGYKDLGCYGSEFYETPRIDDLVHRGVRFSQFYSANPVCSPTRAALMTGKAPQRVGITQWISQPNEIHLPLSELTIGEAFKEAGYSTAYLGKWHLGEKDHQLPNAQGFDWIRCVNRAGQPGSYFYPFQGRKRNGVGFWDVPDLEAGESGDYLTDLMTSKSMEFISNHSNKPFFLCLAHYAVHTPIQSPKKLVEYYQEKKKLDPTNNERANIDERNGSRTRVNQDHAAYAAMVANLDSNIGRVLDHLKSLDLLNDTIIVFTSDNGGLSTLRGGRGRVGPTSCRPLRAGKGWTYEGGIRIPTSITWAGAIKPGECDVPGITMDLYPTLLELAGLPSRPAQHLDGLSLKPVVMRKADSVSGDVSGKKMLEQRFIAWHYPHKHGSGHTPSNAIRQGKWKLVHLMDQDVYELYDLDADVSESNNVADRFPNVVMDLSKKLKDWVANTQKPGESK